MPYGSGRKARQTNGGQVEDNSTHNVVAKRRRSMPSLAPARSRLVFGSFNRNEIECEFSVLDINAKYFPYRIRIHATAELSFIS